MTSRPSRLYRFYVELKRRRVFRVAIAYAAVAFATVSVASDFLPALHLPEWTVTLVAALVGTSPMGSPKTSRAGVNLRAREAA